MTQPIDSQTPLLLRSELTSRLNIKVATDTNNRLLNLIVQQSQLFQEACGRRFDELVETRTYTPTHLSVGGDLYGLRDLRLDLDLKSAPANTVVTNGDASIIATGNMKFEPLNAQYKQSIRLNPYGIQFWYHAGVTDPRGSISVAGVWGYGGQWLNTGATLGTAMTDTTGTSMQSSATLEDGMVVMVDAEYMYISSYLAGANTVIRGYNGSTPTTHPTTGVPIFRWQSARAVQQCMTRLIQVSLAQDESPLFGQIVVGDDALPVTVDSWPRDVVQNVRLAKLKRTPRLQGV